MVITSHLSHLSSMQGAVLADHRDGQWKSCRPDWEIASIERINGFAGFPLKRLLLCLSFKFGNN